MIDVKDFLNEEACEHNESDVKACERPGGGDSCVFDGSYIVLNPIRDVAHLIHGPIACCGNTYEGRGALSSGSRLYRYGFTTDMSEMDIIMGSEKKTLEAIEYISTKYNPSAIFVYSTCIPALTGEDIEKVCESANKITGIPVIPVVVPGFVGRKNLGNRMGGDVLLNYVIGTGKLNEDVSNLNTINLLAEYNIRGEWWDLKPLFEKMGVRVISRMTGDANYHDITCAHYAKLNLLVCGRALINIARGMEGKYKIPFEEVSFYGINNTSSALKAVANHFNNKELIEKTEQIIKDEELKTQNALLPYSKKLKGKKVVLYSGGVKSWSYISALMDLGMEVTAVGAKKSSLSDIEKMKNLIEEDKILKELTPKILLEKYYSTKADIMIAGGRNQYLAYKEKIPFLDINQEKHTPYAGYKGIVRFAEDICKTLYSPVWNLAKKEVAWEV